jgi:peptidoglycan/LPS O-acetylase OafA/YrhL
MKTSNNASGIISLSESDFLKGIGITLIFLHNYMHWSGGTGIENEMYFNQNNFLIFKDNYLNSVADFFIYGFSLFGHFGVQIFIFISAYGLTMKYSDVKLTLPNYVTSVLPRFVTVVLLFCMGVFLTKIILLLYTDFHHSIQYFIYVFVITVTTYKSFFKPLMYEYMGPYWYFSLAIQIYILHPFLLRLFKAKNIDKVKLCGIYVIASYCLLIPLYYYSRSNNLSVFSNIIGHLPEIFLAIYLGINKVKVNKYLFIVLIPILIVSQMYEWLFPFSFLTACLLLLSLANFLYDSLPGVALKIFQKIGEISMIIFILNGPLRMVSYFQKDGQEVTDPTKLLQFTILLLLLSYLIYRLYMPLSKILTQKITKPFVSRFKVKVIDERGL